MVGTGGKQLRGGEAQPLLLPVVVQDQQRQQQISKLKKGEVAVQQGEEQRVPRTKSTLSEGVVNLVKAILGSGLFSLPAAVAAFSVSPFLSLVICNLLILGFGLLCAYTFISIGHACRVTNSTTYGEAWVNAIGSAGAIPQGAATAACFAGCIAFSIIATDSFTDILRFYGIYISREAMVLCICGLFLLPLSLIRNVSGLSFVSAMGCAALAYTTALATFRYFDGSYAPGGQFEVIGPRFSEEWDGRPLQLVVLLSMLSFAFSAHFLAPQLYNALENPTKARFAAMVYISFAISIVITSLITTFGFLTFGSMSSGNIMKSYSDQDTAAMIGRVLVAMSVLSTFPLNFVGLRDGLFHLMGREMPHGGGYVASTIGVLFIVTVIVLLVSDLGVVNSLTGALIHSAIVYIFPSIMTLALLKSKAEAGGQRSVSLCILVGGISIGILGVTVSVLRSCCVAIFDR
jgi:amino acid permease